MTTIDDEAVRMMCAGNKKRNAPRGRRWAKVAADVLTTAALLAAVVLTMLWIRREAIRVENACRVHEERRTAERAIRCAAGALLVLALHPETTEAKARLAVIAKAVAEDAKELAKAKGGNS